MGKYLDIISEKANKQLSTFFDETKGVLDFTVTPARGLKVKCDTKDDAALEQHRVFIEAHCEEIIAAIEERDHGKRELILGDVGACAYCGALKVPSADAQLDIFARWQLSQPIIAHWSSDEMRRLREAMRPGDLLVNFYHQSVVIRAADGRLRDYPRCQA
jgi:hypothetical protein